MKHTKRLLLIVIILSLALLFAACGGGEAEQAVDTGGEKTAVEATSTPMAEPTDTPVPEPTDTPVPQPTDTPEPEPTDTPEPEQELNLSSVAKPEELFDSFRSRGNFGVTIQYGSGESEEQNMIFEMDWVNSDNEYGGDMSMVMSGFGQMEEGAPDEMAIYAVDENMYMDIGGEWISSPRDPSELDSMSSVFQTPEDFANQLEDFDKVGKETINGVKTIHYKYEGISLFENFFTAEDLALQENLSKVGGDIWVAEDGGWVVKMSYQMSGEDIPDDGSGQGAIDLADITWNFEIYEIDTLNEIELPADAPEPGDVGIPGFEAGEFPVPDETAMQGGFGGIYMLESALAESEVNTFYDDKLIELGWSKEEGFMPTWTKGNVSFTLMITPNDAGGTSIMIMAEEN